MVNWNRKSGTPHLVCNSTCHSSRQVIPGLDISWVFFGCEVNHELNPFAINPRVHLSDRLVFDAIRNPLQRASVGIVGLGSTRHFSDISPHLGRSAREVIYLKALNDRMHVRHPVAVEACHGVPSKRAIKQWAIPDWPTLHGYRRTGP